MVQRPRLMRLTFSLMMLLCASSASAAEWREYQTKHFIVWTDLSRGRTELLLQRLETVHVLELKARVGEEVEIPGRLQEVAFADSSAFRDLTGSSDIAGFFTYSRFADPLDTLANVANALGKCPAALVLQRRAVLLNDKNEDLKKTLADYQSRCGSGKAAP